MRKEAIAQHTLKALKTIGYIITVVAILCSMVQVGYHVGRQKTIKEAIPYTMEGTQYIQYGEDVHDYGESMYVKVIPIGY
jgi:hypothetical protein